MGRAGHVALMRKTRSAVPLLAQTGFVCLSCGAVRSIAVPLSVRSALIKRSYAIMTIQVRVSARQNVSV